MKTNDPMSLKVDKKYVTKILQSGFIPTERNFLPFSYRMNETVFGSIVGVNPMFIFIRKDTSRMLVREILDLEEKIFKENDKDRIAVLSQEEKEKYIGVSQALYQLLGDKQFDSDMERIAYLQKEYPELCSGECG